MDPTHPVASSSYPHNIIFSVFLEAINQEVWPSQLGVHLILPILPLCPVHRNFLTWKKSELKVNRNYVYFNQISTCHSELKTTS